MGDVLVAKWELEEPKDSRVAGFWIWDGPDYTWFVMECAPGTFQSAGSTGQFIETNFRWDFGPPGPLGVQVRYSSAPAHEFLAGDANLILDDRWGEYRLTGMKAGSHEYLLLKAGKGLFQLMYPMGGIYVPERFPPLRDTIRNWSKEAILSEVGKTDSRSLPYANNDGRDNILISEAARRGFTSADLERLLLTSLRPSTLGWSNRADRVMRALIETHQLEQLSETLSEITIRLGGRLETAGALQPIFRDLRDSSADFTRLAIRCLSACSDSLSPLLYLAERGKTEEVYQGVRAAVLTGPGASYQESTLARIRERIQKGKARQ